MKNIKVKHKSNHKHLTESQYNVYEFVKGLMINIDHANLPSH